MKKLKSVRTSLWGTLAGLTAAYAAFTPDPTHKAAAGGAAAFFTALLGLSARDHKVSSKSAGLAELDHDAEPSQNVAIKTLPGSPTTPSPQRPRSAPLLVLAGALLFSGCVTTGNQQSLENKAKAIGWVATTKLLQDRPEWRPYFEIARDDLATLAKAETIDLFAVMEIVNRLPTDKLQSGDTALYVAGAMLFFEDELGSVALENPEQLRAAVTGLHAGLSRALGEAPLVPVP